jgi:serine/threonine-protein kinase
VEQDQVMEAVEGGSAPDGAADPRIGRVLQDRYRILGWLAGGGMGMVYRAERLQLGRQVAIKFLHQDSVGREPQALKRFELEARAMSRLSHPNCVSVFDFGVEDGPFLVMDLVSGETLRATIDRGVVPAARALRIARQLLAGLAHAHAQQIIHRDIKPENIILERSTGLEDHVRILDFGLAKLLNSQTKLTTGVVVGTPNYMAPEQMTETGTIDGRTDVYAAGIVLFEMLTGRKPFQHDDIMEVFRRQLQMPPPPLRQASPGPGYSAALEALLLRAMAKSPDRRFPTASAMAAALEEVPEAGARTDHAASSPALDATMYAGPKTDQITAPPAPPTLPPPVPLLRQVRERAGAAWLWALARLRAMPPRQRRIAGVVAAAMIGLTSIIALRHGAPEQDKPRPAAAPIETRAALPASPGLAEVEGLLAAGDRQRAQLRLAELRRDRPGDASLAALQARLYFEQRWWSEGVAAYRAALRSDPTLAGDPILVAHVIRSLQSSRFHPAAAAFLRELGEPARPLLVQAARDHESPSVRARAASILQTWR